MPNSFQFTRLQDGKKKRSSTLAESIGVAGDAPETWLFVSADDEVEAIEGFVGLSNAFTYHLRRTRPARVFVPTSADLHPDHQIVNNELMISLFHSAGAIWPELGAPLADVPKVYELAIYCDFPEPPQWEIRADSTAFDKKLRGIAAYQSQLQIAKLV